MRAEGAWQHGVRNRFSEFLPATVAFALILALGFSSPAGAAGVGSAIVSDPNAPDYCGHEYEVRYEAGPGERNDAQFTFAAGVEAPALTFGPICWMATPDELVTTDLTAPLAASGPICVNLGRQAAECSAYLIVGLAVNTHDQRDLVKVGPGNPPATVSAGSGNDAVNTANGSGSDVVSCGAGDDGATGDPGDRIDADCEKVTRVG